MTQDAFMSAPDQILIIRLKSKQPKGLSKSIQLDRPKDEGITTATTYVSKGMLIMEREVTQRKGSFNSQLNPILEGIKFQTIIKPTNKGGSITATDRRLELKKVKELELRIVSNSSYYHPNYKNQNKKQLTASEGKSYEELKQIYIEDHKFLFNRVELDLKTDNSLKQTPTDARLEAVKNGSVDLELQETLFQYGRYLLISSSR